MQINNFTQYLFFMSKFTIAIHGGAGTILKSMLTPELELSYHIGLQAALNAGYHILEKGGFSIDAVQAAVVSLENNILFNAGKGSVFTNKGIHEMDACLMEGKNLEAGSVAGVRSVKNPILLCSEIMQHSGHVLLSGQGAQDFAVLRGMELLPEDYFYSEFRYNQWQEIKDSELYLLDHKENVGGSDKKFGTVGAVALDVHGNVAAATSTGGMTNKRYGRLGDSCIVGIGNYANNKTCAVSCTGHGEFFIRSVVAYDVSCLMEYKGMNLKDACEKVVLDKLVKIEGEGGLIAVDTLGSYELCFNSEGMYRGAKTSDGINVVGIYK
jgi:beta-aspartyl-peptidase (threonine type)